MTFFRMKLRSEEVIFSRRCGKARAIFTLTEYFVRISRSRIITVHKVKIFMVPDTLPQWVVLNLINLVPAHVRYFTGRIGGGVESNHVAGQKSQALHTAVFFAGLKKCLQPQANSQHRDISETVAQCSLQVSLPANLGEPGPDGSLAGKNQHIGTAYSLCITGQSH